MILLKIILSIPLVVCLSLIFCYLLSFKFFKVLFIFVVSYALFIWALSL